MVQGREDVVGLDSSIILPRETWVASGHVDTFNDPLTECQSCHKRFRADHLQEEYAEKKYKKSGKSENTDDVDQIGRASGRERGSRYGLIWVVTDTLKKK